jgi:hypothetical protein
MRVLTVRQPWAWAIFEAGKDVENRTWSTSYRGELAIHAGLAIDGHAGFFLPMGRAMSDRRIGMLAPPRGEIVGVVDLVDVVTDSMSEWAQGDRYHFILANPRRLTRPLQIRGQQGIRDLPSDVARLVEERITK